MPASRVLSSPGQASQDSGSACPPHGGRAIPGPPPKHEYPAGQREESSLRALPAIVVPNEPLEVSCHVTAVCDLPRRSDDGMSETLDAATQNDGSGSVLTAISNE